MSRRQQQAMLARRWVLTLFAAASAVRVPAATSAPASSAGAAAASDADAALHTPQPGALVGALFGAAAKEESFSARRTQSSARDN